MDGMREYEGNSKWSARNRITSIERVLAFSTTTPLAANAVYTSPAIPNNYNYARGPYYAFSDVTGTIYHEYSLDGITWRRTSSQLTIAAGIAGGNQALLLAPYMRIVYVNGAAAQTIFEFALLLQPMA